jgi:hypothetical protein
MKFSNFMEKKKINGKRVKALKSKLEWANEVAINADLAQIRALI